MERPRVALAARAATQLVVDAAALVPFGGKNVEPAGGERLFLELLNLFPDRLFARFALRAGLRHRPAPVDAHVGVAAELDVGAAAAMLVAIVTAPGTPACATI